jgi:hypothetical protein
MPTAKGALARLPAKDGRLVHGSSIIQRALANDFQGVDAALAADPASINAQLPSSGATALIAVASRGMERMTEHLLRKDGIDIDVRDRSGHDAIDHAYLFPRVLNILLAAKFGTSTWREPHLRII